MTRLYFDCGRNALVHYQESHRILTDVAERFSSKPEDLIRTLDKRDKEESELKAERAHLAEYFRTAEATALALCAAAPNDKLVYRAYSDISPNELQKLGFKALDLIERDNKPLLALACSPSGTLMLVSDGSYPCGKLVKENVKEYGGKGGGRADNARAQFDNDDDLKAFVGAIAQKL